MGLADRAKEQLHHSHLSIVCVVCRMEKGPCLMLTSPFYGICMSFGATLIFLSRTKSLDSAAWYKLVFLIGLCLPGASRRRSVTCLVVSLVSVDPYSLVLACTSFQCVASCCRTLPFVMLLSSMTRGFMLQYFVCRTRFSASFSAIVSPTGRLLARCVVCTLFGAQRWLTCWRTRPTTSGRMVFRTGHGGRK